VAYCKPNADNCRSQTYNATNGWLLFHGISKKLIEGNERIRMNEVMQLYEQFDKGDKRAADELLPIVYDELRRLARRQLAKEAIGQSLQSADLVHEAYLRLVGSNQDWDGRNHFFVATAEAMRRILVERARKKRRIKHGGKYARVELTDAMTKQDLAAEEVILINDLVDSLGKSHPLEAQIVKLHYFAGLTMREIGKVVGVSAPTVHRHWKFARGWLDKALRQQRSESGEF
jgi:RNA polymerase sigma factor (TIGR02999 family)